MCKEATHSHSLLLSSTQDVHPVLDRVPASLSVQDVTQLNIIQVFLQHLETHDNENQSRQWRWNCAA